MHKLTHLLFALLIATAASPAAAFQPDPNNALELDAARAILDIKQADPGIETYFKNAAGYAVFPSIGKGGLVVGGAFGRGLVIANDRVVGLTSMSQATVGFQIGAQKYAQFIFFRDTTALNHFKRGNFEFGAQASAVAVTLGASADASYDQGVAIFTHAGGGLMLEGSVGGQKFTFEPKP
ncbi:MAG: lipid-binding SYLF domain-containing protein [Lysobacterales bacterium]|jgi:lipid-binding SYLF domain-containing protein